MQRGLRQLETGSTASSQARVKRLEIKGELAANPGNRSLMKEMQQVKDDIAKTVIELKDEIDLKLTEDEMTAHSNAWITYQESSKSLKKGREWYIP